VPCVTFEKTVKMTLLSHVTLGDSRFKNVVMMVFVAVAAMIIQTLR